MHIQSAIEKLTSSHETLIGYTHRVQHRSCICHGTECKFKLVSQVQNV